MGDNERFLGKLEEGLNRVSEQVKEIRTDMMEMMKAQTTLAQEVRHLHDWRAEDKDTQKHKNAQIFALVALIISALGVLAQVFLK